MNNVTFLLKPQMRGPEVAGLQEGCDRSSSGVWSFVTTNGPAGSWRLRCAARARGANLRRGDVQAGWHLPETRRIEDNGTVDSATADALNALLREWGLLDQPNGRTAQVVSGEVGRERMAYPCAASEFTPSTASIGTLCA
jgi:hypothetical protein